MCAKGYVLLSLGLFLTSYPIPHPTPFPAAGTIQFLHCRVLVPPRTQFLPGFVPFASLRVSHLPACSLGCGSQGFPHPQVGVKLDHGRHRQDTGAAERQESLSCFPSGEGASSNPAAELCPLWPRSPWALLTPFLPASHPACPLGLRGWQCCHAGSCAPCGPRSTLPVTWSMYRDFCVLIQLGQRVPNPWDCVVYVHTHFPIFPPGLHRAGLTRPLQWCKMGTWGSLLSRRSGP
jgi:hypothetical protein